jgi:hypothetical protein
MASERMTNRLEGVRRNAMIAGLAGLVLTLLGFFLDREHFFHAYLAGWLFWTSISLGSMGVLLLHSATGGDWGVEVRRVLESGMKLIPIQALLFIPLLLGLGDLYEWARPDAVAHDAILKHKSGYLNVPFWIGRSVFYFAIWILIARVAGRLSLRQDQEASRDVARRLRLFSGPALVVYILTMTFAAVDWIMSLDPHWFSTMFGLIVVVGQVLAAFAFAIFIDVHFIDRKPIPPGNPESPLYDLGNLLMAFVMIWAYVNFSQFLIIWQANIAEEIPWYLKRLTGGWQFLGLALALFHFMLPFVLLIWRGTKRKPARLAWVALLLLVMRFVDLHWVVSPATDVQAALVPHWIQFVTPLGIGGLWLALFLADLKTRWDVPVHDMHEREELEHARA